jgi:hypothetical protein
MSDSELRALERRWRETGAVEDEGRWLAARVRAGELDGAWLEALAFFGHEPALLAGGRPADAWDLDDSNVWGGKLRPLGTAVVIRAAHAAAWLGVEPWERAHPGSARGPRPMLEAVEAWLACPCKKHATAAKKAGDARNADPIEVDDDDNEVEVPARWAVSSAGRIGRALPKETVAAATQALHEVARDLKKQVPRPAILAAIRDALALQVHGQAAAPAATPGHDPALELVSAARAYLRLVDEGSKEGGALARAQAALVEAAVRLRAGNDT